MWHAPIVRRPVRNAPIVRGLVRHAPIIRRPVGFAPTVRGLRRSALYGWDSFDSLLPHTASELS